MRLHQLKPPRGSRKNRKRIGRGEGSGHGKTSGRGQKGQNSRSGGGVSPWFEGGQNPLHQRVPKLPGFKNPFKKEFSLVNVGRLNVFESGTEVDPDALLQKGLIKNKNIPVKILGHGALEKALTVKCPHLSKGAIEKIKAAGGKAENS
jgi:large subunit ribosomal protein L15